MICGTLNPEKIWHENLTGLSTSPVRCSYFTSEIQKSHFQRCYSYILLIICVISIIHLPASPENITTLTCELQNFFIWLKVCCVFSNVGGSEKTQLWVVVCGQAFRLCICADDRDHLLDPSKWLNSIAISKWFFKPPPQVLSTDWQMASTGGSRWWNSCSWCSNWWWWSLNMTKRQCHSTTVVSICANDGGIWLL